MRDLYVRGKYRDVILPFTVLRRLDSVLETTKDAVVQTKATLDKAGIVNQDAALRQAAGQDFYNTSSFTMKALSSITNAARLKLDFEAYLDGFSPNVQENIDNFELRNQIPKLSKGDAIGTLLSKFLDPNLDLSPTGLDNHGMGTVFEELVRRFNEDNNEEAGEQARFRRLAGTGAGESPAPPTVPPRQRHRATRHGAGELPPPLVPVRHRHRGLPTMSSPVPLIRRDRPPRLASGRR